MNYRVPSADVLATAIEEVMKDHPTIGSQRQLAKYVREKLLAIDPDYSVTEERVRKIGILQKLFKIQIQSRESDRKSIYARCPVCGSKMSKVRNKTMYGGTVTLGYRCTVCPFWMGIRSRVPVRYAFSKDVPPKKEVEIILGSE